MLRMDKYQELKDLITQMEEDFKKFYVNHDKAAGVRIRKEMQFLRELAEQIRLDISEAKNE